MNTATVEVHDLPAGVQGLIQLGRNAIDRVSELERGIAYRDQMIRQLSEELDDLIKTDETIRQLRARLDEYEQAPTVARVIFENHAREVCNAIPREHLPPAGTELIARPTRKG